MVLVRPASPSSTSGPAASGAPAARRRGTEPPRARRDLARAGCAGCALAALVSCVRAPAVVIVDRKTALEQQASGSFRGLEEELEQVGVQPRAAPLTSAQLAGAGVERALVEDESAETAGSDAARTDALLQQRCIGEANDGTLALTLEPCTGTLDVPLVNRLIERVNRERRQLWRWIAEHAPGSDERAVRASWREVHLGGLVCGGQLQRDDGAWEVKAC
jgi:Protein of unknown function (DUF1318)